MPKGVQFGPFGWVHSSISMRQYDVDALLASAQVLHGVLSIRIVALLERGVWARFASRRERATPKLHVMVFCRPINFVSILPQFFPVQMTVDISIAMISLEIKTCKDKNSREFQTRFQHFDGRTAGLPHS